MFWGILISGASLSYLDSHHLTVLTLFSAYRSYKRMLKMDEWFCCRMFELDSRKSSVKWLRDSHFAYVGSKHA